MQTSVLLGSKWVLLVLAVFVYGGTSWPNGSPVGNAGAWLMVVVAIGWPAVLSGRGCATRFRKQERRS
jgi:mannose/fructose/N-acetylgalactosamine-specific phosphotransferase system component IIC